MHLKIIYQDEWLVAVNKPSGLMVHRTKKSSDRVFLLQVLRDQIGQRIYPVHRLDRPTSGILVVALNSLTAARLCDDFRYHRIHKEYLALVRGYVEEEGVISKPVFAKGDNSGGKDARTAFRCLEKVELPIPVGRYETSRYSLVRVIPETGRKHQIRLHFAGISHPVIGDVNYGDGRHNRMFRYQFGINRLLLSAQRLTFRHPVENREIILDSELDSEMVSLFQNMFGKPVVF